MLGMRAIQGSRERLRPFGIYMLLAGENRVIALNRRMLQINPLAILPARTAPISTENPYYQSGN